VDFFGGAQFGGTLGATVSFGNFQVMLAYIFRLQQRVQIAEKNARGYQQVPTSPCLEPYDDEKTCSPNYKGQPAPAVNAGTYDANSHYLALDAIYRF
jgi:hypothetical protein